MPDILNVILPPETGKPQTGSTQEHLLIKAIHDDVVILKDGTAAMILQTSAVNFDLLSENEQLAIISSFAGLLNSLSFSIQIVIRSKRLDITSYIDSLKKLETEQTNPLLREMTKRYRVFVETLTSENEVLDKQFYLVIPVSYLEIGLTNQIEKDLQKAITLLIPRRDHIIKQLARIGLKASQLNTEKLIRLYYDYYNETNVAQDIRAFVDKKVTLNPPTVSPSPELEEEKPTEKDVKIADTDLEKKVTFNKLPDITDPHYLKTRIANKDSTIFSDQKLTETPANHTRAASPFVVEELNDDYSIF